MPCIPTTFPGGGRGFVCTGRQKLKRCACGRPGTQLCDWKIGGGKTCSRPICSSCSMSPAAGKDLCPSHAEAWKAFRAARAAAAPSTHGEG